MPDRPSLGLQAAANLAKKGVKTAESLVQDVVAVLNPDEPTKPGSTDEVSGSSVA